MTCNECANSKLKKMNPALPLIKTVERRHARCLSEILRRGDNVNGKNDIGVSILMRAAACERNLKCVRILVKAGADVNAVSDIGSTALMFAAEKGNVDCMKYLIRKGADVNGRSTLGETALIYIAVHGKITQAVTALLRANAYINFFDVNGHNAVQTHLANHHYVNSKLLMLLIAAGEEIDGTDAFRTDKARQKAACSKPLSAYLQENSGNISLAQMCRKIIRQHLIKIDPNQHLFYRVPQLGLSAVLSDYLLYNVSIEKSNYEGVDEESEEGEKEDDTEPTLVDDDEDWHEEVEGDDLSDDSYYPDRDEEEQEREEELEDETGSDEGGYNRNRYHEDRDSYQSSEEEGEVEEADNSDDEDYDPENGDDSNDGNSEEDESSTEETEENEISDTDTEDTSDDSSDSEQTESDHVMDKNRVRI